MSTAEIQHQPRVVARVERIAAEKAMDMLLAYGPEALLVFRWLERGKYRHFAARAGDVMPPDGVGMYGDAAIYQTPAEDAAFLVDRQFSNFDTALWLPGAFKGYATREWSPLYGGHFRYTFPEVQYIPAAKFS